MPSDKIAVFLDTRSIHPDDLDLGVLSDEVSDWRWLDNVTAEDLPAAISDAHIVVSNKVVLDADLIAQAKELELICVAATGYNNIDIEAAKRSAVKVCNVRAYATSSVVQHVFVSLLTLLTNIDRYRQDVVSGDWSKSEFFCLLDHPVRELRGMTLGIVGYGELGSSVASVAKCFGMEVLVAKRDPNDMRQGRIDLSDMLPKVDVLSLHCPLNETTRNLIGEDELVLMKRDAILVNTARGGLVDETALLQALKGDVIAGASLDVLSHEPPAMSHPLIRYMSTDEGRRRLLVTPHVAWASRESRQRLVDDIAANIHAYLHADGRNLVS